MHDKPIVIAAYVGIGLVIAIWAISGGSPGRPAGHPAWLSTATLRRLFPVVRLTDVTSPYAGLVAAACGLLIGSRLLWWDFEQGTTLGQVLLGAVLFAIPMTILVREIERAGQPRKELQPRTNR